MTRDVLTKDAEQLWYTWSTIGLDAIAAGFRVRAASRGLTDIYGERMMQLGRYLRYSLPTGSDYLNTRLQDAPICLALVRTDSSRRTLVYKVYTGNDGRNRPGAYFAHILDDIPATFSARNAIALWRSTFWQTVDVPASQQGTELPVIPLNDLEKLGQEIQFERPDALERKFKGVDFKRPIDALGTRFKVIEKQETGLETVYKHLRFLIHAYLLQQDALEEQQRKQDKCRQKIAQLESKIQLREKPRREVKALQRSLEEEKACLQELLHYEPPRIVIAAPADKVAYLIAGLTRLLPQQFLANLTFSTYESDVLSKLPLRIVGTCPPPVALDQSRTQRDILPSACYNAEFALNTYLSRQSTLDDIPVTDVPPELQCALSYAHYAAESLQEHETEELDSFLREMEDFSKDVENPSQLNVREFLWQYYITVVRARKLSLAALTRIFEYPETAAKMLKRKGVREQIFHRQYRDAGQPGNEEQETREEHMAWLQVTLPPLVGHLLRWSELNHALNPTIASRLREVLALLKEETSNELGRATKVDYFLAVLLLLKSLAPLTKGSPTWIRVLTRFKEDLQAQNLLHQYWRLREELLDDVALAVLIPENAEHDGIVSPLLTVAPLDFCRLLAPSQHTSIDTKDSSQTQLRLPARWNYLITKRFVEDAPDQLNMEIVKQFEEHFSQVKALLEQLLAGARNENWWMTAKELFGRLVKNHYRYKLSLLFTWLEQGLSTADLKSILEKAELTVNEIEIMLDHYGATYLQLAGRAPLIISYFRIVVDSGSLRKMDVLFKLLERPISQEWFEPLLTVAKLQVEEAHELLMRISELYAQKYTQGFQQGYSRSQQEQRFPPYLVHFMTPSVWEQIVELFTLNHFPGKMPLVAAYLEAVIKSAETTTGRQAVIHQVDSFLQAANLNTREFYNVLDEFGPRLLTIQELAPLVPKLYESFINDIVALKDGQRYKMKLLYRFLDILPSEGIANSLLDAAQLTDEEAFAFFDRYGKLYLPFCYRSPVARELYIRLVPHNYALKNYLATWMGQGMSQDEMEDVLGVSPLTKEERAFLLENYGEKYLWSYPTSPVLLQLTLRYVQTFDANAFKQDTPAVRFLRFLHESHMRYLASYPDLADLVKTWYTVYEFIQNPSPLQSRVRSIISIIYERKLPATANPTLITLIARALATHIDHPVQFGFVLPTISVIEKPDMVEMLIEIARYINSEMSKASSSAQREIWQQRAAIYLQFALSPLILDELSPDDQNRLIDTLLQKTHKQFFTFINSQVDDWSPGIQERWRTVTRRGIPALKAIFSQPKVLPNEVDTGLVTPGAVPASGPDSVPTRGEQPKSTKSKRGEDWRRIPRAIGAWLVFPSIQWQLWRKHRKRGTGSLTRFWTKYARLLIVYSGLTPLSWRGHIKFACDFHNACQRADDPTTASTENERAILDIVDAPDNRAYITNLTMHEQARIQLARQRTGIAPPLQPSPASSKSKGQPADRRVSGIRQSSVSQRQQRPDHPSRSSEPQPIVLTNTAQQSQKNDQQADHMPDAGNKNVSKQNQSSKGWSWK